MAEATAVTATPQSYKITSLSVSEVWGKSWAFFKDHLTDLIIFAIVYFMASQVPSFIVKQVVGTEGAVAMVANILLGVWSAYLTLGMMKYMLGLLRGKKPAVTELFNNTADFLPFLIVYFIFGIAVAVGFVFLIVPGIFIALMYGFSTMLVADGKATGMEAFSMSAKMTEGHRMEIFVYWLASFFLIVIGFIALIIPGILAAFVVGTGTFLIYEYLSSGMHAAVTK